MPFNRKALSNAQQAQAFGAGNNRVIKKSKYKSTLTQSSEIWRQCRRSNCYRENKVFPDWVLVMDGKTNSIGLLSSLKDWRFSIFDASTMH